MPLVIAAVVLVEKWCCLFTHTVIYGATNTEEKLTNQQTKARRILSIAASFIC
jgi:hypothetical protein